MLTLTPSLSTGFLLVSFTTAVLSELERLLKGKRTDRVAWPGWPLCPWIKWRVLELALIHVGSRQLLFCVEAL